MSLALLYTLWLTRVTSAAVLLTLLTGLVLTCIPIVIVLQGVVLDNWVHAGTA